MSKKEDVIINFNDEPGCFWWFVAFLAFLLVAELIDKWA